MSTVKDLLKDLGEEVFKDIVHEAIVQKNTPSKEVLEIAVKEQRRAYDSLKTSFDKLGTKLIGLLGIGLGLLTYITLSPVSRSGNLFIPHQTFARLLYFAGLVIILWALSGLMRATRSANKWMSPTDAKNINNLTEKDDKKYLQYIIGRYSKSIENNLKIYNLKKQYLEISAYGIALGSLALISVRLFVR